MISELLNEFLIDFAILAFSLFGYLLRPHARRLLAAGKVKLRLAPTWLSLRAFWARLLEGPVRIWTELSRWRLSRAQLRLLELGAEIESLILAARDLGEDDDSGEPRRLEPGLVSELAQEFASSRFPARGSAARTANGQELPKLDLEFVSRDDPVIRSLNWIDVDLICFEPSARESHASDGSRPFAGKLALGGATEAEPEQVRPRNDNVNTAGDQRGGEKDDHADCSDRAGLHGPVEQLVSKGSIENNNSQPARAATTTIANAGMQASNEALNNSGRAPEGRPPSAGGRTIRETKRPPADTKAGPNDDEAAAAGTGDAGDGCDGLRRRRPSTVAANHDVESHFSVSHENQLVHVSSVWGGTDRVLIMLQQQQQQQQRQQQPQPRQQHQISEECDSSRRNVSKRKGIVFCLVKFYTSAELLGHSRRAALIFYLIQLHSQRLVQLFGLLSVLLERAGLLRTSGFWCRASWPELESSWTSGNVRNEEEALEDWLELIGWELDQDDQSGRLAGGGQSMRRRRTTLLDRYALLLMIAAHLERERTDGSGRTGGQIGLASSLMGFLESFSALPGEREDNVEPSGNCDEGARALLVLVRDGHSKAAAASRDNVRMEIEFVPLARRRVGPERAEIEQLAVFDPIGPVEGGQTGLGETVDELTNSETNLTANLSVWPEIRQLFADSLQHLRLATAPERPTTTTTTTATSSISTTTNGTNTRPVLAGLARLAQRSRHERRRQLPDLSAQIAKLWSDSPRPVPIVGTNHQLHALRDSGKQISSGGHHHDSEFARANTITSDENLNQSRQTTAGRRLRLKTALGHALQNKLGRSIFLLVVFVTIRLALMQYLARLQRDLMYETRDDFIALKRMVFPEGLQGLTENEEGEDAGDGISILTREERRQRAEAEARRRASYRATKSEPSRSDTSQRAKESELDDGARNEKDNGHDHDHPAPIQRDAIDGGVNQVMEALLASLMSQALGGGGGASAGDFSKMDPAQLQEMVRMLERFESGEDEGDDGDLDYEDIDDVELDKLMNQMELSEGFGTESAAGNLGEPIMGDADGLAGSGANIDLGVGGDYHDDGDDDDNNRGHYDDKEEPIRVQAGERSTHSSGGATTTSAQSEL